VAVIVNDLAQVNIDAELVKKTKTKQKYNHYSMLNAHTLARRQLTLSLARVCVQGRHGRAQQRLHVVCVGRWRRRWRWRTVKRMMA
jgi:ATP-dependent helicase/DNAse subunit B